VKVILHANNTFGLSKVNIFSFGVSEYLSHISRKSDILMNYKKRNERTNQRSKQQTRMITIFPGGDKNQQYHYNAWQFIIGFCGLKSRQHVEYSYQSSPFLSKHWMRDFSLNDVVIVEKIKDTQAPFYRPQLPEQESASVHPDMLTLMKQSWAEEPSERPSFVEVAKVLKTINQGKSVYSSSVLYS